MAEGHGRGCSPRGNQEAKRERRGPSTDMSPKGVFQTSQLLLTRSHLLNCLPFPPARDQAFTMWLLRAFQTQSAVPVFFLLYLAFTFSTQGIYSMFLNHFLEYHLSSLPRFPYLETKDTAFCELCMLFCVHKELDVIGVIILWIVLPKARQTQQGHGKLQMLSQDSFPNLSVGQTFVKPQLRVQWGLKGSPMRHVSEERGLEKWETYLVRVLRFCFYH